MKNKLLAAGTLAALLVPAARAGTFYGLYWDGSAEQFVSVNPYTSALTVIKEIPGVKYISPGVLLDPDSSRYGFVGMEDGMQKYYYAIHAPTGDLVGKVAKTDTISGQIYSPNDRKVYGLSWSDTSVALSGLDSAMQGPRHFAGKEYFVALDPFTGARTNTYLPGVVAYQANSAFLDSDSGRYVFTARERNGQDYYYVLEAGTGAVSARIPATHRIDNPVYNPALGAVHGLYWADSSYYPVAQILGDSVIPGPRVLAGTEYFVTVHRDSTFTRVAIPGVKYIATFISAFDSDSGRYVFVGGSTGSDMKYYVIDAATGTVISQTARTHNVNNLAYAPDHSTVDPSYGPVHVAARRIEGRMTQVRSFDGFLILDAAQAAGQTLSFAILDVSGKTLLRRDGIRDGRARIDTRGLKNGIHLYQIRSGSSVLGQGKVLIR
jgi:hypothetical protein